MPQLTQRERLIILALMVHQPPEEVTNSALAESYGFKVSKEERENLVKAGFVTAYRAHGGHRPYVHELTSEGRERAVAELAGEADSKSAVNLRVVYAIFNALHEFLRRNFLSAETVFSPEYLTGGGTDGLDEVITETVQRQYEGLVDDDSGWVPLRSLREATPEVKRDVLDETLREMFTRRIIRLSSETNRRRITEADDEAALPVSGEKMHWLRMA
ncbi:hypothetical protein AB0B28_00370 [Glycomyces sp. NPDC046736]|uniref:hypothetical protein n=1 Tax=Glycomyces sp. NPDC046736 TaxID=3155615 RepID=UPI00340C2D75